LRILTVNESGSEHGGGVEVYWLKLKEMLEADGHQVRFFTVRIDTNENKYIAYLKRFFSIKYYRLVKKEAEDFKPDMVFAHSFLNTITPSFLIAVKKMRLPVVVGIYGFGPWTPTRLTPKKPYSILSWIRFWLHMMIVKRYADAFECPSQTIAKHLVDVVGVDGGKVRVIPHPNDWPKPKEAKKPGNKDIIFVGRLVKIKGVEYLIQAMPEIIERHPEARLHIIGEGGIQHELEDLADRLNIKDKVIFHGYLPQEDLFPIVSRASVVALPSISPESFGLTLIEATSQKVPVITTNIGGQAELVQPGINGFLVNPMDAEDLAEKICLILDDPELAKELGENGRKMVERDHTPEKHLSRMLQVYQSVAKL
jgi:glycosyltransferase involved in cell wall biosynthesis